MADNMMRIAGRGTDGTAKAVKTDNGGKLETLAQISGVSAGATVALTAVDDGTGKFVLRVVDAAPFAYDPATGSKKVQTIRDYSSTALVNNLSLRDDNWTVVGPLSDGSYTKMALEIYSNLDQPIVINLLYGTTTVGNLNTFKDVAGTKVFSVTVPASFSTSLAEVLWIDDWAPLKFGRAGLYLQYRCATAPTSGTLQIRVVKARA